MNQRIFQRGPNQKPGLFMAILREESYRWLVLCFLFCIKPSIASTMAADTLLQEKLSKIQTMTAHFQQVVMAKNRKISSASGTMALARPGRFRWQTKKPMPQLVIADGKKLWVYDVDLEQVTVKKQAQNLGGTAALFLSSSGDQVTRDFTVSERNQDNRTVFDLRSKASKASFQRITLTFSGDALISMGLFDQLGQHTTVQLSQIKINPALSMAIFRFKPPKGVDVVEQ